MMDSMRMTLFVAATHRAAWLGDPRDLWQLPLNNARKVVDDVSVKLRARRIPGAVLTPP
jgi:hypothetical protein